MKSRQPDNGKNGQQSQLPIAIVGMACIFPKAGDVATYWSNIVKKVDAITDIPSTHWKPEEYFNDDPKLSDHTYARKGGFISPVEFDPMEFGITPNTVEATDTSQLLGLVVARQALDEAGYGADRDFNRENVSVILGITGALELVIPLGARLGHPRWRKALRDSGIDNKKSEEVVKRISDSYVEWQENSFPGLLGNVVAGRIANRLDFGGTNCVVDAACASSLGALHLSCMELGAGRSDMVIAGGLDTFNDIFMYMCFSKTPVLSPAGHARPFDHREDGTVLGEGVGVLILKRLEDAKRDEDKIYAVIKGVGSSSDGKGNAIYMPTSSGQARALRNAYKIAGVSPDSIELVEAHGTGTKVGDAAEVNALSRVYSESGRKGSWCALGSVKSQIGHTKAAAGIAGVIKSVMALKNKVLPPTIKVEKPIKEVLPGKTPFYINTMSRPWIKKTGQPRRAAVSAFGFGGSNFHCVLEEYKTEKESVAWDPDIEIMAFSSSDVPGLAKKLRVFSGDRSWNQITSEAPGIRRDFDSTEDCRISMVLDRNGKSLAQLIKNSLQMFEKSPEKGEWSTPDHVFFQKGRKADQALGVIFPGQGSQYCGMLRELACAFPQLHNALEESGTAFKRIRKEESGLALSDYVFPVSGFDETSRQKNELELRRTEIAQPSIGSVSLGAFKVLEYFGLCVSSFAGHSFGELTALAASGRLKDDDFFRMSVVRGELMACQNGSEGAMIAVRAPEGDVEKIIREERLSLVVANRNAPTQVVLSGELQEVRKVANIFLKKRMSHIRLPVSGAFHSSLVSGCRDSFFQSVKDVKLMRDFKPVYSNTTGETYPENGDAALKLLSRQLAEPVEFINMIENMYRSGITTFLEVGPGSKLSRIISEIIGDRPADSYAIDCSSGRSGGLRDLAVTLSRLSVGGHALNLSRWNEGVFQNDRGRNKKKAMNIPICGANYFRPAPEPEPERVQDNAGVTSSAGENFGTQVKILTGNQSEMRLKQDLADLKPSLPFTCNSYLKEALKATGESMAALQKMQEETARLHSQFLTGQTKAQEAILSLIERQQALFDREGLSGNLFENGERAPVHVMSAVPPGAGKPDETGADGNKTGDAPPGAESAGANAGNEADDGRIVDVLLQVISEKTGYPREMLELDMGMDADLGIDSIKQVEILSAISEKLPGSPGVKPEQMGELNTLRDLAAYLSKSEILNVNVTEETGSFEKKGDFSLTERVLMEVVSEKTGYPREMLEPDMGMDSDLGIDSIKQVEILSAISEKLPGSPGVKPEQMGELNTLRDLAAYLSKSEVLNVNVTEETGSFEKKGDFSLTERVLMEVVSEKTGYPREMLEPDMGMDSDLGIDSIKQVEILSAISEKLPGSPGVKPEQMGELNTLRDLASYLSKSEVPNVIEGMGSAGKKGDFSLTEQVLMEVVSEKTGYPREMLEPDMGMDSDLGIDSIKQVEILSALSERLPDSPEVKPDKMGAIRTLRELGRFLENGRAGGNADAADAADERGLLAGGDAKGQRDFSLDIERRVLLPEPLESCDDREDCPVNEGSTIWIVDDGSALSMEIGKRLDGRGYRTVILKPVPSETPERPDLLGGLVILSPVGTIPAEYYSHILGLIQLAGPGLRLSAKKRGAVFVTVSRLDGSFGLNGLGAEMNPLTGGLSGFSKTIHHEWPEINARAIDLTLDSPDEESAAASIVDEMFKTGPVEVGISGTGLTRLALKKRTLPDRMVPKALNSEDVMLITGGARGVTAEVAVKIAKTYRCRVILVGRTRLDSDEPVWLRGVEGEKEIKRAILENSNGNKPTPVYVGETYRKISAVREIEENIRRIRDAGSDAHYISSDVTDNAGFKKVMADIQSGFGPVTGVIHGAGVLFDRKIEDKTAEQFEAVLNTKVSGINTILSSIDTGALKVLVLFSSSTGRYGRTGQLDYAVANEILNKIAQKQARLLKNCRVLSVNWGPWDGGMVTPELKKIFKKEGVGVIGLNEGAEYLVNEIESGRPGEVEVVVIGEKGLDCGSTRPVNTVSALTGMGGMGGMKRAFSYELTLDRFSFLASHIINEKPVLPMAVMIEWCAQAALHANPGLHFTGFNNFTVLKGVVIEPDRGYSIEILTGASVKRGDSFLLPVEIRGMERGNPAAIHARGEFVLSTDGSPQTREVGVNADAGCSYDSSSIYSEHLFHGEAFQSIYRVEECGTKAIQVLVKSAPPPSEWIKTPGRSAWITDPLVIDSAFQAMILWTIDRYDTESLPCSVGRYTQYQTRFPADGVRLRSEITMSNDKFARADIWFLDRKNFLVAKIDGYECALNRSLRKAFNNA